MENSSKSFGQIHFAGADLGDERLSRRLPQLVDALVEHPAGTLPDKLPKGGDCEAFYRLCDAEGVTHKSVLAPHLARTLQILQDSRKFLLVVHDGTEFDYTQHRSLTGLGQIGNGGGRGFVAHNSLVVDPQEGGVLGLAGQILHTRPKVPANESMIARRARESRESRLWLKGTEGLPSNRFIVDVCDRLADTFEFLGHELKSGRTFVIRSARNRKILIGHGSSTPSTKPSQKLHRYAQTLPVLATSQTTARVDEDVLKERRQAREQGSKKPIDTYRQVTLNISAGPVTLTAPRNRRGEHTKDPLQVWIVRVWEPDPPPGCEALEWFLLTNHAVKTAADARRVKSWYEWRWVVEEYHKALKTGCGIEDLQFRKESRLKPAIAIISVVALTLLQLRDAARRPDAKTRRADTLVNPISIEVLSIWSTGEACPDWTVSEYYLALARLGGYRARRNCPPGWQVLWRGHSKLNLMVEGATLIEKSKRCSKKSARKCAKR